MNISQSRLRDARSSDELVSLARDFLAGWDYSDLALLPKACQPAAIKYSEDLLAWHYALVEAYCSGAAIDGRKGEVIRDFLAFFSMAVDRQLEIDGIQRDLGVRGLFTDKSIPNLFADSRADVARH